MSEGRCDGEHECGLAVTTRAFGAVCEPAGVTAADATAAGATATAAFPAGEWGRSCAGQSLRRAPLAGLGLDEALPRRRGGQGRQAA